MVRAGRRATGCSGAADEEEPAPAEEEEDAAAGAGGFIICLRARCWSMMLRMFLPRLNGRGWPFFSIGSPVSQLISSMSTDMPRAARRREEGGGRGFEPL